jgi:hypothetical protein
MNATPSSATPASAQTSVPIPAWEVSLLNQLGSQGSLSGVPPYALAGIAENESGGEVKGAGIASSGDGGYFGNSETEIPSSTLLTSSSSSFVAQAEKTASMLAGYDQPAGLLADVATYNIGGGGYAAGGWQASADAVDVNALSSGTLAGTAPVGLSLANDAQAAQAAADTGGASAGGGTPTSGSAPTPAVDTSVFSTIGGDLFNLFGGSAITTDVTKAGIVIVGVLAGFALFVLGVYKTVSPAIKSAAGPVAGRALQEAPEALMAA